jgi:hypothetical protein
MERRRLVEARHCWPPAWQPHQFPRAFHRILSNSEYCVAIPPANFMAGRPRRISARQSNTGNRLDPCARNAPPQRVHRNVHWFCMFSSRRPSSASSRRLKRCARSLPRACDQGSVRLADLPKRKCGRSLRHAASSSAPARSRRNLTKSRSLAGLSARYSLPTTHYSLLFLS